MGHFTRFKSVMGEDGMRRTIAIIPPVRPIEEDEMFYIDWATGYPECIDAEEFQEMTPAQRGRLKLGGICGPWGEA